MIRCYAFSLAKLNFLVLFKCLRQVHFVDAALKAHGNFSKSVK